MCASFGRLLILKRHFWVMIQVPIDMGKIARFTVATEMNRQPYTVSGNPCSWVIHGVRYSRV